MKAARIHSQIRRFCRQSHFHRNAVAPIGWVNRPPENSQRAGDAALDAAGKAQQANCSVTNQSGRTSGFAADARKAEGAACP